jgi:photosystem II stability/assembly factor-like uncharacterized protein
MPVPKIFVVIAAVTCFVSFPSCKKNSDGADSPAPVTKNDTLTAGWSKVIISGETGAGDIFFNSATNGYLVGSRVYRSTDGGNNWNAVLTNSSLYNLAVTNDGKAFFAGQTNTIVKTIDGGNNFVNTVIGITPTDIFFTDNSNGFAITHNGLYNTVDGGLNWTKITTTGLPSNSFYFSLYLVNNNTGWIVTQSGVYRSVGSLATWQQSTINGSFPAVSLGCVFASSATNVYIGDNSGVIYKSTDGGTSFSFLTQLDQGLFTDLHFLTDQLGYASSGRNIYKTTDAGVSWSKVVSLAEGAITEIHFTDATHGWACASGGKVLIFKP